MSARFRGINNGGSTRPARFYRGVLLMPEQPNAAGIRWTARIGDGLVRRADSQLAQAARARYLLAQDELRRLLIAARAAGHPAGGAE